MKTRYLFITALLLIVQNVFAQEHTLTGVLLDVNNKIIKNHPVTLGKESPVTVKTNKHGVFTFTDANLQETLYIGDKKGKNPIAIPVNGHSYITIKSQKGNFNTNYLSEPDMYLLRYLQEMEKEKKKSFNTLTKDDIKSSGCLDIFCLLSSFPSVSIFYNNNGEQQIQLTGINNTIKGSTAPLIVVNGVPGGSLEIPIEEIEDITILKEATIYGTRGANGAIVINLKK